jgi:predicted methyltransferase
MDKINGRASMRIAFLAAVLAAPLALMSPPAAAQQQAADPALAEVLVHPRRADDRGRDARRHPAETLDFFRVEPGMTVVDYMPAGGWFSRILIPYLGPEGTYIALDPELHPEMTGYWDTYRNTAERFPGPAHA